LIGNIVYRMYRVPWFRWIRLD